MWRLIRGRYEQHVAYSGMTTFSRFPPCPPASSCLLSGGGGRGVLEGVTGGRAIKSLRGRRLAVDGGARAFLCQLILLPLHWVFD